MDDETMKRERELAREQAEVMLAFAEGKRVQVQNFEGKWSNVPMPSWNWADFNYRVVHGPRRFWVNEYADGLIGHTHETREAAVEAGQGAVATPIELVEVME